MLCKHLPLNPVPNNCCSPSNSKCDVLFNWVQCTFLNSQMWIYLFHWYLFVCVCFERVSPTMTGLRDRPLPHLTWDHKCQDYESIFLCLACVYNLAACRESLQLTQDYNNSQQSLRHQPEKGFTNVSNNMLLLYFFFKMVPGLGMELLGRVLVVLDLIPRPCKEKGKKSTMEQNWYIYWYININYINLYMYIYHIYQLIENEIP